MVCATEIYEWFKDLSAFNRIDFLCNLLQLCLPNELRFIGTILDDMNNKDYANLRDAEDRSNSPSEFSQYSAMPVTGEIVRKLCLSLSLLKSTNQKVGQMIYEILWIHSKIVRKFVRVRNELSTEILLLYALASYHPAVTFENRFKLGQFYRTILSIYRESRDAPSDDQNNSCCYSNHNNNNYNNNNNNNNNNSDIDVKIAIKNVTIMNYDARIIMEITTNRNKTGIDKDDCVSIRAVMFSSIRELFNDHSDSSCKDSLDVTLAMNNLVRNGNFTEKNVHDMMEKIVRFAESKEGEKWRTVKRFLLQLPDNETVKSHFQNHTKIPVNEKSVDTKDKNNDHKLCSKYVFQTPSFNTKSFEDRAMKPTDVSIINGSPIVSEINKSMISSNKEFSKEHSYSTDLVSDGNNQRTEIITRSDLNEKYYDATESSLSECSDNPSLITNGTNFPDVGQIQMRLMVPHFSVYSAAKSSQPIPLIFYNHLDTVSNSGHPNTNKIGRPVILASYPGPYPFSPHVSQIVPLINSTNQQTLTFTPINEMNLDFFPSQRLYSVTNANVASSSPVNKLSSSTPPRLQSNYQKSSQNS